MPITDINELSHDPLTDEQIIGLINRYAVRIDQLLTGDDFLHDQRENGDAGFEIKPMTTVAELRKLIEMYTKMLENPAARGDVAYILSQWDNPEL